MNPEQQEQQQLRAVLGAAGEPHNWQQVGQVITKAAQNGQLPAYYQAVGEAFERAGKSQDQDDMQVLRRNITAEHTTAIAFVLAVTCRISELEGQGAGKKLSDSLSDGFQTAASTAGSRSYSSSSSR